MNESDARQESIFVQMGATHVMLPQRLTQGIIAQRFRVGDGRLVASNVPPLRHHSQTGFDYGHDGAGSSDLALACVHAILTRLDYGGPNQTLWDGSRIFRLAYDLHVSFRQRFLETAAEDELLISWRQGMGWVRQELLALTRRNGITSESIVNDWRDVTAGLPDDLPGDSLGSAELLRDLRKQATGVAADAAILLQFLGMVA